MVKDSTKRQRKLNTTAVPSSPAKSAKWYRETTLFQELRLREHSWRDIADLASAELGYSIGPEKVRKRVMSQWAERVALSADEALASELALLARVQDAAIDLVESEPIEVQNSKGDTLGMNYGAKATGIGHLVRISESRRKLLGLDKPAKTDLLVTSSESADETARALLAELDGS